MNARLMRPSEDDPYVQIMADAILDTDLNTRFIHNQAATILPLAPDGGIDGIYNGDVLIVNRSLRPKPNRVIFAEVDGVFCLRRLQRQGEYWVLEDDKGYELPRRMTNEDFYHGTVTHNIHAHVW